MKVCALSASAEIYLIILKFILIIIMVIIIVIIKVNTAIMRAFYIIAKLSSPLTLQ